MANALPLDLEATILAGAVAALRKRAAMLRRKAAPGITVVDGWRPTIVVTSESP